MISLNDQVDFALNVLGQMKSSRKSSARSIEIQTAIVGTLARCQMLKEAGDELQGNGTFNIQHSTANSECGKGNRS